MTLYSMLACPRELIDDVVFGDEIDASRPWLHAKIDGVLYAKLGEILCIGAYDHLINEFTSIISDPMHEYLWVIPVPVAFSEAISTAETNTLHAAARDWAEVPEFRGMARPDELATFLESLRKFFASNEGPFFLVAML